MQQCGLGPPILGGSSQLHALGGETLILFRLTHGETVPRIAVQRLRIRWGSDGLRRFPPPWSVEDTDACLIVCDQHERALAYVYFENEPGRRAAAHLLTRARRIAANIAKLPELLSRS
jgi:hypothetical protein